MDRYINNILKKLSELNKIGDKDILTLEKEFHFDGENDRNLFLKAVEYLKKNNLIVINPKFGYQLTEEGMYIIRIGGIEKFRDNKIKARIRKDKKEEYDFQISRLQANSKYFPYIVSTISVIIACFAYFKPIDKSNIQQLSQDELIYIIDSISSSIQTKMVDSLHNSRIQSDSLKIK